MINEYMNTISLLETQNANFDKLINHRKKKWVLNKRNFLFSGQWQPLPM